VDVSRPINPLGVRPAATRNLQGRDLADFRTQEAAVAKRLAGLRNANSIARN
jgi:hypothetical protein